MKKIIVFFILIFSLSSKTMILASFNSLHLGWDGKNYYETAKILSLFDIIALQEVMKKDGIMQDIAYYTELINKIEPELKAFKVKLAESYKQLERLESKNE